MDDVAGSAQKRMRLAYHHKHKIQNKPQELPPHEPTLLPAEILDKLLIDSIKSICEEEGLKQGVNDAVIESVVLESLRNAAEDFTLEVCSIVRRSMFAARRVAPIAPDFESAISLLRIPRPDDQIHSYQTLPTVNPTLLPTPPPDDPFHTHVELPASFLGPELSNQNDLKRYAFNTSSLPPLPSAHTYKDSAVYTTRETDSRKIREMATEEGKLGEQALRKLAAAVKLEAAISIEPEARTVKVRRGFRGRQPVLSEEAVFEETMRDLLHIEGGDFEIGPIVTSEKAYRMPDSSRVKRKPKGTHHGSGPPAVVEPTSTNKYNVLPPPFKKQSTSITHAE